MSRIEIAHGDYVSTSKLLESGFDENGTQLNRQGYTRLSQKIADLQPLVDAYSDMKKWNDEVQDLKDILDAESPQSEMYELAKEELTDAQSKVEDSEQRILLALYLKMPMIVVAS